MFIDKIDSKNSKEMFVLYDTYFNCKFLCEKFLRPKSLLFKRGG